jgi:hypothetical protein
MAFCKLVLLVHFVPRVCLSCTLLLVCFFSSEIKVGHAFVLVAFYVVTCCLSLSLSLSLSVSLSRSRMFRMLPFLD